MPAQPSTPPPIGAFICNGRDWPLVSLTTSVGAAEAEARCCGMEPPDVLSVGRIEIVFPDGGRLSASNVQVTELRHAHGDVIIELILLPNSPPIFTVGDNSPWPEPWTQPAREEDEEELSLADLAAILGGHSDGAVQFDGEGGFTVKPSTN